MTQAPAINLMDSPGFRELIDGFSEVIQTSSEKGLEEARRKCTSFFLNADPFREEVESVQHVEIEGQEGNLIPLRIYKPKSEKLLPLIVYLHRGGWIFGNNEESEPVCRLLAHHLEAVIVAVDYRLAPEVSFPKPLEDAYAATDWASKNISSFGGDPGQLIVCGESAGGNLAAAVALMARDLKGPAISCQLLIYPIISATLQDAVYDACPDQHFLTKGAMQFMWGAYLQNPANAQNPYASLDCAKDLSSLPAAVVVTGEYDPLRQEAESYAQALREAGVAVQTLNVPGVIHGFLDLPLYESEKKIAWVHEIRRLLSKF